MEQSYLLGSVFHVSQCNPSQIQCCAWSAATSSAAGPVHTDAYHALMCIYHIIHMVSHLNAYIDQTSSVFFPCTWTPGMQSLGAQERKQFESPMALPDVDVI